MLRRDRTDIRGGEAEELTVGNVVAFLLERRLLDPAVVVDHGLTVVDVSRRNRNLRVHCRSGPSFFVKQGLGPEGAASVAREAVNYEHLVENRQDKALRGSLPRLLAFDAPTGALVLELLTTASSLELVRSPRSRLSTRVAGQVAGVLAALHTGVDPPPEADPAIPWALTWHRLTPDFFRHASAAQVELARLVQADRLVKQTLDALAADWRPGAFTHQDLKSDNVLLDRQPATRPRLFLADWELAGSGDPRWDVGSVLGDYLHFWARGVPFLPDDVAASLSAARCPLEHVQKPIRRFWDTYCTQAALPAAGHVELLRACVQFAAVRLLQSAYERSQAEITLPSDAVQVLQLAVNVMERPLEAGVQVFGIPLAGPS